jgi:2',3'-cyclic-nucleotide 2'-phosphodiesterase (5'-nucleotidase family)
VAVPRSVRGRGSDRLDVILGGHSHDTLPAPEYVGDVPIVHAGPYGDFASRTEFERRDGRAHIVDFALEPLR